MNMVLSCLKALSSGSLENYSKDFMQVSHATVSGVLTVFANSIASKVSRYN